MPLNLRRADIAGEVPTGLAGSGVPATDQAADAEGNPDGQCAQRELATPESSIDRPVSLPTTSPPATRATR